MANYNNMRLKVSYDVMDKLSKSRSLHQQLGPCFPFYPSLFISLKTIHNFFYYGTNYWLMIICSHENVMFLSKYIDIFQMQNIHCFGIFINGLFIYFDITKDSQILSNITLDSTSFSSISYFVFVV